MGVLICIQPDEANNEVFPNVKSDERHVYKSLNGYSTVNPNFTEDGARLSKKRNSMNFSLTACVLQRCPVTKEVVEPHYEKPFFAYAETKTQISFAVTAKLISVFVFATRKVQSLYFLNQKFQASGHLL